MTKETEVWAKRTNKLGEHNPDVHSSIQPADVRPQERVVCRLRKRCDTPRDYTTTRTWRLSPLGIEVSQITPCLTEGDDVDLEIVIAGQRTVFRGLVVIVDKVADSEEIVGVRFSQDSDDFAPEGDRRSSPRWSCSQNYYPLAVAPSPTYFDEWMYFQIHDISESGMQLNTSLTNKYLVQGLQLQLTAVFPMGGSIAVRATIARVNVASFGSEDRLVVGVSFVSLEKQARRIIGQYLIQFSGSDDLESFRQRGFLPKSVLRGVKFSSVRNIQQYRSVLKLRFDANAANDQLDGVSSPSDLSDIEDSRARIVAGFRNDLIVATVRVRFPTREDPLEAENYIRWPKDLPDPEQCFELSRLAVDPDFQGSDTLAGLFRYLAQTCVSVDRHYIVFSTMEKYRSFYRRAGFRDTGLHYKSDAWSESLHVMLADAFEVVAGQGVNPLFWASVWADVSDSFVDSGIFKPTGIERARIATYKLIKPIAPLALSVTKSYLRLRRGRSQ